MAKIGGDVNIVVFDTTENWYCYTNLGSNLSYLDILRIEVILQDMSKRGEFHSFEKW